LEESWFDADPSKQVRRPHPQNNNTKMDGGMAQEVELLLCMKPQVQTPVPSEKKKIGKTNFSFRDIKIRINVHFGIQKIQQQKHKALMKKIIHTQKK
jgi:hypothetical protein